MSSPGAPAVRPVSRAIARAAVQAELGLAAYELVVEKGVSGPVPISLAVKVGAALECMGLTVSYWAAADGGTDLVDLLREGFAALSGEDV